MKRAIVIVLDGCGAGAAPDAARFGDHDGPSTLYHVWEFAGRLNAPNLERLGFLAAAGIPGVPEGRFGRLRELSMGKDSVTGHWEMMGVVTETAFPTYPNGFPTELVEAFTSAIGREVLANRPASGTQIIQEFGAEHIATAEPILYTSADSVFQIAAHEDVVPIETLYDWCRIARALCVPPHNVQRVIARPFLGSREEGFRRTERRKDFPLAAPANLLDQIGDVDGIGVVPELFDGRGFRLRRRTQSNAEHEVALLEALQGDARFIFANFEDFDMLYGHRNDPAGFALALEAFDRFLDRLLDKLAPDDLLMLTSDHGNDPTTPSTDHSREYVPVALFGSGVLPANLGDVDGMTAVGATVATHLGVEWPVGKNLLA
jgi:phosphopentomutase